MMTGWMLLAGPALLLANAKTSKLPAQFEQARALYYQAIDGEKKSFGAADNLFTRLYCEDRAIPLVQVYYGSLRLLEASHTWALWKKNTLSREGIGLMDHAVATQPDNLEIRFVRAATTYHLPGIFHRQQQSRQDFAYLAQVAVEAARTGALEPRLAAASLYFNGEFLQRAGREKLAETSWRSATAVAPSSSAAREAREKLSRSRY